MKYKKFLALAIFLFIAIIPLAGFLYPGLPITHDGQDHVARIANFYQNLQEGNLIPRWAPNLNWGYGHPILMFLYPLPSYLASFFHLLGFHFIDSVKIVFMISFVLSGVSMFLWIRESFGDKAGFVASILYMFAPYRFVDLYVRGAIGEHVAFIFPPLILFFLLKLVKYGGKKNMLGACLSLAGLILSHNAVTIMFLPIIIFYCIFLILTNKNYKRLLYHFFLFFILGFGLTSAFWIPAFLEGKYTLRDIVTKNEYANHFVLYKNLFYGQWSYGGSGSFSVQVGIVHWFVALASIPVIVVYKKRKNNMWLLTLGMVVVFFAGIFLMLSISRFFWDSITILQKFQFPWRLLSITVFTTAALGGITMSFAPKKFSFAVLVAIVVLIIFLQRDYWHANGYLQKPDAFFTGIYNGTTDTGESAPRWSVRFMEQPSKAHIEVIEGAASVKETARRSTVHEYTIFAESKTRIRENTLYFPGWVVLVDGKEVEIEFQDQKNRGIITFYVEEGKHTVSVQFKETKLRIIANVLTLVSIVAAGAYVPFLP